MRKFIVPCGYSTELFKFVEKAFYNMTLFILVIVAFPWVNRVGFRGNAVGSPLALDIIADFNRTIGFISHNNTAFKFDIR